MNYIPHSNMGGRTRESNQTQIDIKKIYNVRDEEA